jgi:hypothetical protein
LKSVAEESFELENTVLEVCPGPDCAFLPSKSPLLLDLLRVDACVDIDSSEVLDSKGGWWLSVELGDSVEDIDSLLLLAFGQEELGGLVEIEDEKSEEKDQERDTTKDTEEDSPAEIVAHCTAGSTSSESRGSTRW